MEEFEDVVEADHCAGVFVGDAAVELIFAIHATATAELLLCPDHDGIDETCAELLVGDLLADIGRRCFVELGFEANLSGMVPAPSESSCDRGVSIRVEEFEIESQRRGKVIHDRERRDGLGLKGKLLAEHDLDVLVDLPRATERHEVAPEVEASEAVKVLGVAVFDGDVPAWVDKEGVLQVKEVLDVIVGLAGGGIELKAEAPVVFELDLMLFEQFEACNRTAFGGALFGRLA